ncbi:MAG: hypothetical protein Q8M31_19365 [Beijerinckiaceae bacterium]|nr:hypothetical protein [Beijerinckiaceae bacterium]
MPTSGAVTVSDLIEAGETHVEVACDRCDRHGSYQLARVLAEKGDIPLPDLLALVSADCPARQSLGVEMCGAMFVGL